MFLKMKITPKCTHKYLINMVNNFFQNKKQYVYIPEIYSKNTIVTRFNEKYIEKHRKNSYSDKMLKNMIF